jgi:tetratricopeptide (TPR) repeat protein
MARIDPAAEEWLLVTGDNTSSGDEFSLVQKGGFRELFELQETQRTIGADRADSSDPSVAALRETFDFEGFVKGCIATQHSIVAATEMSQWLLQLMCIGIGALRSYLQANVTGPPLPFNPEKVLLPECLAGDMDFVAALSKACVSALNVDGESVYHLAQSPILLVLARTILNGSLLAGEGCPQTAAWWRLRVNFLHQRILSEKTGTLYKAITRDIDSIEGQLSHKRNAKAMFHVEKAMVDTYFGNDAKALEGLETAAALTGLKYALTGAMGKRTKFQQRETSQLVVLAKSAGDTSRVQGAKPQTLDLRDDTLLESIAFTKSDTITVKEDPDLPEELAGLDPNSQPPLEPLDATILLLLIETIKNTNPEDGITREEMMPYAERVLSHSTNWEVYTLGLLVRSRIEASRSRTVERSVLQLQAVVDQVIAETATGGEGKVANTFLPQSKEESALIRERLCYIHQLPIPPRWELEAELASRWVHIGGLRTALEIYERLELWPEVALCWAATEQEEKARNIIQNQLIDPSTSEERTPPPSQAPRMWCILGDIDRNPQHYEKAWEVSKRRYARAMRSLGRHYFSTQSYQKAAESYEESLKIYPIHGQSWFSLGCCRLQLEEWEDSVRAFRRAVKLDDTDAEAWSNLATALLRCEIVAEHNQQQQPRVLLDDEEEKETLPTTVDPQRNRKDALRALKKASQLKRESWQIWENYLTVAVSINPPEYKDIVIAMKHLIELRKGPSGELAVDADVLDMLVQHIINEDLNSDMPTGYDPSKPGLLKQVVEMVEKDVVPLITTNQRLWKIIAKLELWRKKPKAALDAHEKAWRAVNSRPSITDATEKEWDELVDATVELADAYESLGQLKRTEGLGAGEIVAKDWKFKARSAVRSVIGKGKTNWEGTKGWDRLEDCLGGLKSYA